jgi:hypothetical protein
MSNRRPCHWRPVLENSQGSGSTSRWPVAWLIPTSENLPDGTARACKSCRKCRQEILLKSKR